MLIGSKTVADVVITDSEGQVLAIVSDTEIVERNGITVSINEALA